MELRPGYKRSEGGVTPPEWQILPIGEIARFSSGMPISVTSLHALSSEFPVPVFGGNGIAGYTRDALTLEPTVIVGRVGQKCGTVYLSDGPAWVTDNALYPQHFHRPVDVHFLAMSLAHAKLNNVRNRNDLPLITQTILQDVRIACPPLPEQRAIAAALSDVDALIASLDRLIAKKRDIKQAAMQQLLTGKTRLPGFNGEDGGKSGYRQTELGVMPEDWETRSLKAVAEIVGGGTPRTSVTEYWDGSIPWVSAGDVSQAPGRYVLDTADCISELGLASCPAKILPQGTIVIVARGTVGKMAQLGGAMAFNQTCYGLRPRAGLDQDYLYYSMKYSVESLKSLTYGTIFGTITTQSFLQWKIPLPPLHEQRAIATVLSDMDAEIAALEVRRDKTRLLKQGMMQELLTGRTRLI